MIDEIIAGLIKAMRLNFDYDVYTENVEQGLEKPCFFIFNLQSEQQRKLGSRHRQIYSFAIQYIPETDEAEETSKVISKLFSTLDYIEVSDGLLQTFNIKCEVVDDVLNCFVTYVVNTVRFKEQLKMDESKFEGGLKSGK